MNSLECPVCSKPKKENNKYCSYQCRNIVINRNKDYSYANNLATRKIVKYVDDRYGKVVDKEFRCENCNEHYSVKEREFKTKEHRFCGRSCSNARKNRTEDPKLKTKNTLIEFYKNLSIDEFNSRYGGNKLKRRFRSKHEFILLNELNTLYPELEFELGDFIEYRGERFQRDLISKKLKLSIELDGEYHFIDIFGDLDKIKEKELRFEEAVLNSDWRLIRVLNYDFKNKEILSEIIRLIFSTEKIIKWFDFNLVGKADYGQHSK